MLQSEEYSLKMKGIYCLCQSFYQIPGFELHKNTVSQLSKDGRDGFDSGWKELIDSGLLKQSKRRVGNKFSYSYTLMIGDIDASCIRDNVIPYAQVPNCVLRCRTLSLKAKGLYAMIQAYCQRRNFVLYKSFLMQKSSNHDTSFDSAWKELIKAGYLVKRKYQDAETHRFKYEYELVCNPGEPGSDFPYTDIPGVAEPGVQIPSSAKPAVNKTPVKTENYNNLQKSVSLSAYTDQNDRQTDTRCAWIRQFQSLSPDDQMPVLRHRIDSEAIVGAVKSVSARRQNYVLQANSEAYVKEIEEVLYDLFNMQGSSIRIGSELFNLPAVQYKILNLSPDRIADVILNIAGSGQKISNPRAYILKSLYTAASTALQDTALWR